MKKLLGLRSTNAQAVGLSPLAWKMHVSQDDVAEIAIFDVIGDSWDGTTAKDFVRALRDISAAQINLRINSPGGFVDDAIAMYDAIAEHPAYVTAFIDTAASAASFVAMAANKTLIARHGKMMIHPAQGFGMGDGAAMRSLADILDEETANIASIYAEKSGKTTEEWLSAMNANGGMGTTYRGQEAIDVRLADGLIPVNSANNRASSAVNHEPPPEESPDEEKEPAEALDDLLDLIPPLANGYSPPIPTDFSRLVAANMPASSKGAP